MFLCYWNNMYSLSLSLPGRAYFNVIASKTRCTFSPNLFCRISVAEDRTCLFHPADELHSSVWISSIREKSPERKKVIIENSWIPCQLYLHLPAPQHKCVLRRSSPRWLTLPLGVPRTLERSSRVLFFFSPPRTLRLITHRARGGG